MCLRVAIALCGLSVVSVLGGGSASGTSSARARESSPACLPRAGVQLLAASRTTAVFTRGRRVIVCGPGTSARTLVTQTRGRRVDAASVRGDRVAVAGRLSSADAFGGQMVFNVTRVLSLPAGASYEQQNFGTVRSVRLTARGTAVGLERAGTHVSLFAALPEGRLLLDRRRAIGGLRLRGERVGWSTNGRRRSFDTTLPVGSVALQGPIPDGHEPLKGAIVAPFAGRYSVSASPTPTFGRGESCPYAYSETLRAISPAQRIDFELRPAYARWCQAKALLITLTLDFGRDAGPQDRRPRCAGRPTPCGGSLEVGRVLLPANSG